MAGRRRARGGPQQRTCALRPSAGGVAGLGGRGGDRSAGAHRGAVLRWASNLRVAGRRPDRGGPWHHPRSGWCGCTIARSPTGWYASSNCRYRAGEVPDQADRMLWSARTDEFRAAAASKVATWFESIAKGATNAHPRHRPHRSALLDRSDDLRHRAQPGFLRRAARLDRGATRRGVRRLLQLHLRRRPGGRMHG